MIVQFETNEGTVEADLHWDALKRAISKVSKGVDWITFQTQREEKPPSPIALLLQRWLPFSKKSRNA